MITIFIPYNAIIFINLTALFPFKKYLYVLCVLLKIRLVSFIIFLYRVFIYVIKLFAHTQYIC